MNSSIDKVGVILLAAGISTRMSGTDKIIAPINGLPAFWYPLKTLIDSHLIDQISIIASETNISKIKQYLENWNFPKTIHVFVGGKFRQDSVRIGIESLSDSDIIVIHDAARPFITNKMLIQGLNEVKKTGCSTVAIKTTDSMKIVSSENFSIKSLDRTKIWNIQTPQFFIQKILQESHQKTLNTKEIFTDDTSLIESQGYQTKIFEGSNTNIKITTQDDLILAETILKSGIINNG